MKKWLLLVPLLLGLSLFCSGQAVTTLDQNCNVWGAAPATPQCGGAASAASGTQLFFPDIRGTITNQFEVVVQGTAPGSLTVTVVGCMRGGTCSSTLGSSSGTSSQIITPSVASLNVYDKYGVTVSWTGGDSTTRFVINRTGTVAKLSGGSGAFSGLSGGTNTTATMTCGTGCQINTSGSGLISASTFFGSCASTIISGGTTSVIGLGMLTNSAGTCATSIAPTTTAVGGAPANNCNAKNLSITSSAAGTNASDGVATIYTGTPGGTLSASSITCTIGTAKTCQDNTHQVAVTPGQIIVLGVVSQAASTLTNLSASVLCQ